MRLAPSAEVPNTAVIMHTPSMRIMGRLGLEIIRTTRNAPGAV